MKNILRNCFIVLGLIKIADAQNVGIGTTTPTAKLTVNGNIALLSDTVNSGCGLFPTRLLIDNITKNKSVFHIVSNNCNQVSQPLITGLSGGADGKIVTLISHVNNMQVLHLQAISFTPSSADSLNMIELYEPNSNGSINQPSTYTFNNGGSVTLIYDINRKRWKPLNLYGDYKIETAGWIKGPDPNNIYNPNSGNVGIGTGIPSDKMDINGNLNVQGNIKINHVAGQSNQVLGTDGAGNTSWINYCSFSHFQSQGFSFFNPSTTFTVPPGITQLMVECWSPGGGGALGGGGGAGGYVAAIIKCSPSATFTVGQSGSGGSGSLTSAGSGGTGGDFTISGPGVNFILDGGKGATQDNGGYGGGGFLLINNSDSIASLFKAEGSSGSSSTETFQQRTSTQFVGIVTGGKGGDAYNKFSTGGSGGTYMYDVNSGANLRKYFASLSGYGSGGGGGVGSTSTWGTGGGNAFIIFRW